MTDTEFKPAFELLLAGYEGGNDATDHLVKWVHAPSIKAVITHVTKERIPLLCAPHEIGPYTKADGIDFEVDANGNLI